MWKGVKFHDKALYTQREKEIKDYENTIRRKIKIMTANIKLSNNEEEKKLIRKRIKELIEELK